MHRPQVRNRNVMALMVATALTLSGCGAEDASDASPTEATEVRAAPTTSTSVVASECANAPAAGVSAFEVAAGGRAYPTEIYRPEGAGPTRLPAVIDLHGLDSGGPAEATMTGFRAVAEREGLVVANPSGPVGPLGVSGWEVAALDEAERDDIGAIAQLIADLVDERCVDPDRVFVAGYSNGGFLAAELGCSTRVRVAAIVAIAGFHAPTDCDRHVPTLVMHGTADPIVPFGPGGTSLIVDATTPEPVRQLLLSSIEDEVATSAAAAGCGPAPTVSRLSPALTKTTYAGCASAAHELVSVDGGGHTWPGAAPTTDADFLGPTTAELDATSAAWTFFEEHSEPS